MRARVSIAYSGAQVGLREVVLKDKPAAMLEVSPKGTVPVLIDIDGTVIEPMAPAFDKINQNFAALMNQNGSGQPVKIWTGSRTEYDALTPDSDTLYFITG